MSMSGHSVSEKRKGTPLPIAKNINSEMDAIRPIRINKGTEMRAVFGRLADLRVLSMSQTLENKSSFDYQP